jgi:hypothetical protein
MAIIESDSEERLFIGKSPETMRIAHARRLRHGEAAEDSLRESPRINFSVALVAPGNRRVGMSP